MPVNEFDVAGFKNLDGKEEFARHRLTVWRDTADSVVVASSSVVADMVSAMSKKISAGMIRLKRAYEPASAQDGPRILVDRLWPRGLKKKDAQIDQWAKDIAPSTELRKWFGHEPERWQEFRRRYMHELQAHSEQLDNLRELARSGTITLVYAAHDEVHNHAVVARDVLLAS